MKDTTKPAIYFFLTVNFPSVFPHLQVLWNTSLVPWRRGVGDGPTSICAGPIPRARCPCSLSEIQAVSGKLCKPIHASRGKFFNSCYFKYILYYLNVYCSVQKKLSLILILTKKCSSRIHENQFTCQPKIPKFPSCCLWRQFQNEKQQWCCSFKISEKSPIFNTWICCSRLLPEYIRSHRHDTKQFLF